MTTEGYPRPSGVSCRLHTVLVARWRWEGVELNNGSGVKLNIHGEEEKGEGALPGVVFSSKVTRAAKTKV